MESIHHCINGILLLFYVSSDKDFLVAVIELPVLHFNSDFNPQNDLQAQARCHRIGQTKSVAVYRLLSRKTYELQMFHMSSLKMGLDQAVLQGVENKSGTSKGKVS